MRSPSEMLNIQIDITNACVHKCSNCTRFCGNHQKPFFMSLEDFKRAVDSLEGFPGVAGIIGGEPTVHPEFDKLIEYLAEKRPEPKQHPIHTLPVQDFTDFSRTIKYQRGRRRGLFTSFGRGYYKHFELIQDVFPYQSVNDHQTVNQHQAILVTRKELGIPDDEWFTLRDNCWIQNLWSAAITPKGAFFCEIAASLDMLFNGPGGWPVEPGWWKRTPKDFADQLHWCELCSVALNVPTIAANERKDIISPVMLEKLKAIKSPRVEEGNYVLFDPKNYDAAQYGHKRNYIWYLPDSLGDLGRTVSTNATVKPQILNLTALDGGEISTSLTHDSIKALPVDKLSSLDFKDWVAVAKDSTLLTKEFVDSVMNCVLNPGCLYYWCPEGGSRSADLMVETQTLLLFNRRAHALKGLARLELNSALFDRWGSRKRVHLDDYPHLGKLSWKGRLEILWNQFRNRAAFLLPF